MGQTNQEIEQTAIEWSVKLSGDDVDEELIRDFELWRTANPAHQEAFARAEKVWNSLTTLDHLRTYAQIPNSADHNKSSVAGHYGLSKLKIGIAKRFKLIQWGGAAVFATLLMSVLLSNINLQTNSPEKALAPAMLLTSELRQTQSFTLQDGSRLTLGPKTELRVTLGREARKAELLRGEVLFEVSHSQSRPFVVITHKTQTRVLGTVFNVKTYGKMVKVSVKEGKVAVKGSEPNTGPALLTDGQGIEAAFSGQLGDAYNVNAEHVGAWHTERFIYDNATLREIVDDINRYSSRRVILTSVPLENLRVTLSANNTKVDELLVSLSQLLPIEINRDRPESIVIQPRQTLN